MICRKGFECMKLYHSFFQLSRTLSVATQPLFYKSEPDRNFYKRKTDHDHDRGLKRKGYDDKFQKNKYAVKFTQPSRADTFGNLNEVSLRSGKYKEDPDDVEELNRQRNVVYKPFNRHIHDIKTHLGKYDYQKAVEILVHIIRNEQRRAPHFIYDLLLSYCGRTGDLKEAYGLYLMLKKRQYPITGGNYTSVFNAAALCPQKDFAIEKIRKVTEDLMTSTFHRPNVTNYNAMIKAYARHGDMDMCLKIVDAVLAERGSVPTDTYNHLLQACVTDKNSGLRHAIAIWHKMLQKKCRPDKYTFNLLLRCVRECSLGPVELIDSFVREILRYNKKEEIKFMERKTTYLPEAVEVVEDKNNEEFEESKAKELEKVESSEVALVNQQVFSSDLPNLLLRNPVIGSIIKLNKVSTPQDRFLLIGGLPGFFKLLSDFKVEPNHKMITQVLDVIPDNFEAEEDYIKLLGEKNIKLQTDFFNVLLKRRIFRDEKKEIIQGTFKLLPLHALTPDIHTYGILALSCDNLEEAQDYLKFINEAGVRLTTVLWNSLLFRAMKNRDLKFADAMIKVGKEEEIQPDSTSLKYLKVITRISNGNDFKPRSDGEDFGGEGPGEEFFHEESRVDSRKGYDFRLNEDSNVTEELKSKVWGLEPDREKVASESEQSLTHSKELSLQEPSSQISSELSSEPCSEPSSREISKSDAESIHQDAFEQIQGLNPEFLNVLNPEIDKLHNVEPVELKSKPEKKRKKSSKSDLKTPEILKSKSNQEEIISDVEIIKSLVKETKSRSKNTKVKASKVENKNFEEQFESNQEEIISDDQVIKNLGKETKSRPKKTKLKASKAENKNPEEHLNQFESSNQEEISLENREGNNLNENLEQTFKSETSSVEDETLKVEREKYEEIAIKENEELVSEYLREKVKSESENVENKLKAKRGRKKKEKLEESI